MCLGICGKLLGLDESNELVGHVDVEGVVRDVNLAIVSEDGVSVGDWVLIHMGVAIEVLDAQEAEQVRSSLEMMGPGGSTPGWSW